MTRDRISQLAFAAAVLALLCAGGVLDPSLGSPTAAHAPSRAAPGTSAVVRPASGYPDPRVYSALGDSITPAYDANSNPIDLGIQPWYSYAVGNNTASTGVFSLYQRLLTIYGNGSGNLTEHLLAVPGDKAADMIWQSLEAVYWHSGFVTILIGGNDVCHSSSGTPTPTSVANFSQSMNHTLRILSVNLPNAVIAIGNVVNVSILWTLFGGNSQAELVWQSTCPALLTAAGRTMMQYMVRAYNHMEDVIVRSFARNFTYAPTIWDIGNLSFSTKDVNHLDFFHPSPFGHAEIAHEWWAALPYASMFPRFTSPPALPASLPVGTSLQVQVGVQDVERPTVSVTYKSTAAFFWSTVPLSNGSGQPANGTFQVKLPFNATSAQGTLQLYFSANDSYGYSASLPAGSPSAVFQLAVTGPPGPTAYPLSNVSLLPGTSTLTAGATTTFQAQAFDTNGSLLTSGVAYGWTLSPAGVGQLVPENDGSLALFVAGETAGQATITVQATSGVVSTRATASVEVSPLPPPTNQPPANPGPSPSALNGTMPNWGLLVVLAPAAFLALMAVAGLLLRRRYLPRSIAEEGSAPEGGAKVEPKGKP